MTPPSSPDIVVEVFGHTDVGRTRPHNEDTFVVADLSTMRATPEPAVRRHLVGAHGSLFMVADGMGGAAAGELASQMATEVVLGELEAHWVRGDGMDAARFAAAIRAATEAANLRIHRHALEHPSLRGMGTTATVAGLLGEVLYVAQVGDSRAYLVRGGQAVQITKDQSLMQKLVEAGEVTPEEAEVSVRRNIILQALGPEATVRVDLTDQAIRRGDVLILCSDGLSGQVRAHELAEAVREEPDLEALCIRLVEMANAQGGPDNITVVAARFDGPGLRDATDTDDVGHHVYRTEAEVRTTVPLDADAVSQMAPTAAPSVAARTPAPPAPAPRASIGQLRVVFGAVLLAYATWWFLFRR